MRIGRTLPPAAAPILTADIWNGFKGCLRGQAEIQSLKNELKEHFKVKHCHLVSSGKAALSLILNVLHGLHPARNEVLIPAFTCYSVPSAVVRSGLRVRLCDVDPETLAFDHSRFKQSLEPEHRLLAVVCPHHYGLPADIERVKKTLENSKAYVIEDAAPAIGSTQNGVPLGTRGDVGFFSLGRGKAYSTVEGGIIITNSDQIGNQLDKSVQDVPPQTNLGIFKLACDAIGLSIFMQPCLFWIPKALPGLRLGETIYDPRFPIHRFSPFQAGLARNRQKRIAAFQAHRISNVRFWEKNLVRFPYLQPICPRNQVDGTPPLIRYPALVHNENLRNALLNVSEANGLGIMPSYPDAIISGIEGLPIATDTGYYPGSKQCARRLVTFPVHPYVGQKERLRILECLEAVADAAVAAKR